MIQVATAPNRTNNWGHRTAELVSAFTPPEDVDFKIRVIGDSGSPLGSAA